MKITMEALIKRINRRLASQKQGSRLITFRKDCDNCFQRFHVINTSNNFILEHSVDPQALGRRLKVI